jgi:hypothetical protein
MNGYVIADTQSSIFVCKDKSGSYSLTTDRAKAIVWENKPSADAVFKSNLSKLIKSKGVLVKSVAMQMVDVVPKEEPKQVVKEVVSEQKPEFGSSKYIVSVLSETIAKLNCRHLELSDELSKFDRQITDIEHYIEFNAGKFNACEGYKAYKLLQDVLVKRRKVKDELQILQVVKDKMAFPDDIENIQERVKELEERKYEPRELKYLFGGN